MRRSLKSRRGFSLIEALAAFAILAMALGQLLNGVSGGVRNEARADFLSRAAREGSSHLDSLGVAAPAPFGESSGRYPDGLYWSLSVSPGPSVADASGQPTATSLRARLVIRKPSGYGESLTLTSVKIKPVEPPRPQ